MGMRFDKHKNQKVRRRTCGTRDKGEQGEPRSALPRRQLCLGTPSGMLNETLSLKGEGGGVGLRSAVKENGIYSSLCLFALYGRLSFALMLRRKNAHIAAGYASQPCSSPERKILRAV